MGRLRSMTTVGPLSSSIISEDEMNQSSGKLENQTSAKPRKAVQRNTAVKINVKTALV